MAKRGQDQMVPDQTNAVPREELRPASASCLAVLGQGDVHQEAWEQLQRGQQAGVQAPDQEEARRPRTTRVQIYPEGLGLLSWGPEWRRIAEAVEQNMRYTNSWEKSKQITAWTC